MIPGYLSFCVAWSMVVGTAFVPGNTLDTQWAILTGAGAILASAMSFFLGARKEGSKIIVGRAIGALFTGICATRFAAHWFSPLQSMLADPILIIGFGFGAGVPGYLLAHYVVKWFSRHGADIVDKQMNIWHDKLNPKPFATKRVDEEKKKGKNTNETNDP